MILQLQVSCIYAIIMAAGLYPGQGCEKIDLSIHIIKEANLSVNNNFPISNGVILELKNYFDKNGKSISQLVEFLCKINSNFETVKPKTLQSKIYRTVEIKSKLVSKKKVKGYTNINQFYADIFITPVSAPITNTSAFPEIESYDCEKNQDASPHNESANSAHTKEEKAIQTDCVNSESINSKDLNLLQYKYSQKLSSLNKLEKDFLEKSQQLASFNAKLGHYSVRNVNKRDETAKKILQNIRKLESLQRKYERTAKERQIQLDKYKTVISTLNTENAALQDTVNDLNKKMETFDLEFRKKSAAQKLTSYYKIRLKTLKSQLKNQTEIESESIGRIEELQDQLKCKDKEIEQLQFDVYSLQKASNEKIVTKLPDGTYTDCLRICVIELASLEVATEKVSPVLQSVCKHLYGQEMHKTDLPNSTSVQTIVDEGHYLAKTYISKKIEDTETWGVNRDGTSRRKQKILDTSVTLDNGEVMSLGFRTVSHETAKNINNIAKDHVSELSELNQQYHKSSTSKRDEQEFNFIATSLEKLSFSMSDRASNEKLADEFLNDWRDDVLKQCGNNSEIAAVHNFHCMAHVLLGFHRYVTKDIKDQEKELVGIHGALGRDSMAVFKFWKKSGTVVERVVRTVSDTFGPAGNHLGVRDRWEAYCSAMGIKSTIGNYKDNRFNALFQTAAEVHLHRKDFITVIDTVITPNLKIKSVLADLKDPIINILIQVLGIFFVKITGPYWNMVTSGKIPYLELYPYINDMLDFLRSCSTDPHIILNIDGHWSSNDPFDFGVVQHGDRLKDDLFVVDEEHRDLLFDTIRVISGGMVKTIEKQLVDFLPGGKHFNCATKENLERTKFAHLTNLGCEHHFGDLDSSQRRRPSASMHHHSSVQLLKPNRTGLIKWLGDMDRQQLSEIMKSARKGGKILREKHLKSERNVRLEIHEEMMKPKTKINVKKKITNKQVNNSETIQVDNLDPEDDIIAAENKVKELLPDKTVVVNEYVAVAYQDNWYPGIVTSMENKTNTAVIKFLLPCRKSGNFQWPTREDIQKVNARFIIKKGFIPECVNSGRQWFFSEYKDIDNIYEMFKSVYF